jgi:Chaperone of endosialidase
MSVSQYKNSLFTRDGIHVQYSDYSEQNISFADKTLTVDSGLVVNNKLATLNKGLQVNAEKAVVNAGLEVNVVKATLNAGLDVNNVLTKLNKGLEVTEKTKLKNDLEVVGASTLDSTLNVLGATNLGTTLEVVGAATLDSTLDVTGASALKNTLDVTGATKLHDALEVTAATTLHNILDVSNSTRLRDTLTVDNMSTLNGGLEVKGNPTYLKTDTFIQGPTTTINSDLYAFNPVSVRNTLEVTQLSTLRGGVNVLGAIVTDADLSVGRSATITQNALVGGYIDVGGNAAFHNDVVIDGNLTVLGTRTAINATDLEIKDNTFLMADGNTTDIIETGFMMQYKPTTSSAPLYSGLKRAPVSGEFIFFKDAANKIGQNDLGSEAANDAIEKALADSAAATAALNSANAVLANIDANIAAAAATREAARLAAPQYSGADALPAFKGEYVTINYGSSKTMDGFNLGRNSGWTRARTYVFLASDDDVSYRFLAKGQLSGSNQDNLRITWTSTTFVYLRIVFVDMFAFGGWWGPSRNDFCPFFDSPDFRVLNVNQVSYSSGCIGFEPYGYNTSYPNVIMAAGTYNRDVQWPASVSDYLGSVSSPIAVAAGFIDYAALGVDTPTSQDYLDFLAANQTLIQAYLDAKAAYATTYASKATNQTIVDSATVAARNANAALVAARSTSARYASDKYAMVIAESFNCHSDSRLKKDITPLDSVLEKLDSIRGVRYNWAAEEMAHEPQVGVIAQEIKSVYPELVKEGSNGFLSVDYPKLTAVLIQAVKELKALVLAK